MQQWIWFFGDVDEFVIRHSLAPAEWVTLIGWGTQTVTNSLLELKVLAKLSSQGRNTVISPALTGSAVAVTRVSMNCRKVNDHCFSLKDGQLGAMVPTTVRVGGGSSSNANRLLEGKLTAEVGLFENFDSSLSAKFRVAWRTNPKGEFSIQPGGIGWSNIAGAWGGGLDSGLQGLGNWYFGCCCQDRGGTPCYGALDRYTIQLPYPQTPLGGPFPAPPPRR